MTKNINTLINKIIQGDALQVLKTIPDNSVDCIVTSPPYWALRDYEVEGQLGLEPDFNEYLSKLIEIFDEAKRTLKDTGTCWINMGDTYSTPTKGTGGKTNYSKRKKRENFREFQKPLKIKKIIPDKSLCLIPFRFAVQMVERGWILRNVIIWHKPNAMPQSAKDRLSVDFEYIFFLTKSPKYYFKQIKRPISPETLKRLKYGYKSTKFKTNTYAFSTQGFDKMRQEALNGKLKEGNERTVWSIPTKPCKYAHFATFPKDLIEKILTAGCPPNGIVLDPFIGSGTTAVVAKNMKINFIGIELNPKYIEIANERIKNETNSNMEDSA
jgi:DNA modification methylase